MLLPKMRKEWALLLLAGNAASFSSPALSYLHQLQSQTPRPPTKRWRPHFLSSSGSSSGGGGKELSASGRERREEDQRRRQRKDDVIIGRTSALRDATDYALTPKATEEAWLNQASRIDQQVYRLTEDGFDSLKMLQLEDASTAFDQVFELKPEAYLWQAGIVKFYLDDLERAANLFASNALVYERKFGDQATEERIWRHACELKMASALSKNCVKNIKAHIDDIRSPLVPMPEIGEDSEFFETRKVFRIAKELFEASINSDQSGVILARAKLRSIGGNFDAKPKPDLKMWKLNAWFFLGLHYDAIGEIGESKECMKMALRNCPSAGHGADLVHTLPLIHMSERDWFDDDNMDIDPLELLKAVPLEKLSDDELEDEDNTDGAASSGAVDADPLIADSIRKSIAKMRLIELQNALRTRGIKAHGAKKELQNRLFRSLMADSGFKHD